MSQIAPGRQYEQKEFLVGFVMGAAWHTPVDVSAKVLQFVEAINFPLVGPARVPDPGIGRKFPGYNPPLGKIECKGDISMSALTYGQMTAFFAMPFGSDASPTQQGATTAYKHTLTVADSLYGKFGTLAYLFNGGDSVEFPSVKINSWEISCNPGEPAKGKFSGLADYPSFAITDSVAGTATTGVWTPTVSPAWITDTFIGLYFVVDAGTAGVGMTYPITANNATTLTCTGLAAGSATSGHIGGLNTSGAGGTWNTYASDDYGDRLHFDDLIVRIGAAGTADLTSSDDFNIGSVKLNFERPMAGDFRSASTGANVLSKHAIWEPRDSGVCKMECEITFPNFDAQTKALFQKWISTAPLSRRLELCWTSTLLAGVGYPYMFKVKIPGCFISGNAMNIPASGGVPVTLKFSATYYTSGGTDTMPTIEITNKETAAAV